METLTDPKDPLGILKKPKNSTPTVEEKDPLGILKKKDNTVSEPNSNAGSTQAGLGVSQEPGPKDTKPSEKSTESNWFTKLGDTLAAPVESFVRGSVAALTDMLPGMVAAGEAGMTKNDYENVIVNKAYPSTSTPMGPVKTNIDDKMRKAAIDNYINKVGPEQYKIEKDAYELNQLRRRSNLLKYSDQQDKERQETMGDTPQTTGEIKDVKTALQWLGGAGGNALGTAPAMIAGPVFLFLMEKGEAYKEGLGKIQEQTGLSRDEILALDLDKAARENSDISGSINSGLELAGNLAVFGRFIPKNLATKFISKVVSSKVGAPAVAAMGEGVTEFIQAIDTKLAAYMATGKYADVFEAANAITPEEWKQIREEGYTGAAGGTVISAAGGLMQKKGPAPKLADAKTETPAAPAVPPAPAQVVSEARTSVKSADDTQGAEAAAEKIVAATEAYKPGDTVELSTEVTNKDENVADLTLDEQKSENKQVQEGLNEQNTETTGETPSLASESKSLEAPVQEEQGIGQGADMEFTSTVGENYVKRNNRWFVKDAEGIERPLISDNPNKTQEEQNTELTQLKELKAQLETETPVKVDLSPTGKSRIAEMEAFSPEGRVRKWLFGGGQLLWNSKSQGEGKPTLRGLKDETGYSNKERQDIKQYVHDTNGISVEQAAEQLAAQYQDRSPQEYRNAIIEVFSSDPKKWYEQQVRDEDPDYAIQEEQRFQEASQLNEQIKQLETQEEGIKETNQQLYENERRVNYGSPAAEGQAAEGQMASPGSGSQTQVQPRESIRKAGDANKSKQALEELKSKNLTHVPGLGMGQNQAKGTYVSTEDQNRYETEDKKPVKVKVNVQKPFVSEGNEFYDIQREIIQSRFGKNAIEDLTETEADLLAEMVTEHFTTEGFDSIYMPQSETQEGELIVFDRSKVTIMDEARIEYENAVHESTQTTLQLEFIPDAEFLKTDKPIELREKQKKIRKDLARLNQLIKCR